MVQSRRHRTRSGERIYRFLAREKNLPTFLALAGFIYLGVRCIEFLMQSGYPPGYFFDLGVHILATTYQANTVRSFGDFLNCIGWAAWADVPQFIYNPMTTSFVLVAVAKAGAGTLLAIKLLTVAQVWIAMISMAVLYRTIRRSWAWATIAGLFYALLPATALQISSNFDIGFSVAFAPLALATGFALVRKYGSLALPLCGAICGFAGLGFATEYLFIVSIPLYVAIVIRAFPRRRRISWALASMVGAVFSVGVGLYCILPTFASTAVLTSPASRIAESENGGVLSLFGESITALWHGVLTESTLSPWPEFNDSNLLWSTSVAMTILWCAGALFILRLGRRRGALRNQAIYVGLLLLLSFGSAVPFAATFWAVLSHIPFVQFLRTPDRLVILPFIYLVWWSVAMCESLARERRIYHRPRWTAVTVPATLAIVLISFGFFDFHAGALIVRPSVDYRLPSLRQTNAVAIEQPRPLVAYTFVNQGSVLNTPLYGEGATTRIIAQDLISRYGSGPAQGLGVLRKAGIQTIVTTPVWALDGEGWPDLGAAYKSNRWTSIVSGSSTAPAVWHIRQSAPEVSETDLACFHGGPGNLDEISLLVPIHRLALDASGSSRCKVDVYSNADPRDELIASSIQSWPSTTFSNGAPVLDRDYPFIMNRLLLARSWYRNSVEGDSPLFGSATESIPSTWDQSLAVDVPRTGRYLVSARYAAAYENCLAVSSDRSGTIERCASAQNGLHWLSVPISLRAGRQSLRLFLHPASKVFAKSNQILDGITLGLPFDIANSATSTRPKIIIYSTQWLQSDVGLQSFWLPAGSYRMHWFTADGSPVGNGAWLDGHRSATYEISRAGFFHTASPPLGATTLVFAETGAADPISSGSIGTRRSATSWDVQTPRTGTVRATVLNDHHWSLDGEGRHYDGFDCDLVDTCFGEIPRGRYVLRHQWPDAVIFGIVASLLVWLVSFTLCWMASERFRRLESGR